MSKPFVSVIIPVFNSACSLALCLDALGKQTYPEELLEVIVVDNGSKDDPESVTSKYEFVRTFNEAKPGSYAARNLGLLHARGEVIAFTDADCVPSPEWIENSVRLLEKQSDAVIVGNVVVFPKEQSRPTSIELYEIAASFPQKYFIEKWNFGPTANLIAYKSTFDAVGHFDGELKSCGDVHWGQRAVDAGFALVYADDVVVSHPARRSVSSLYSKVLRIAGGVEDLVRNHPGFEHPMRMSLLRQLLPPINHSASILNIVKISSPVSKLKIVAIVFFVRYAGVLERLRLRLGGKSQRC